MYVDSPYESIPSQGNMRGNALPSHTNRKNKTGRQMCLSQEKHACSMYRAICMWQLKHCICKKQVNIRTLLSFSLYIIKFVKMKYNNSVVGGILACKISIVGGNFLISNHVHYVHNC